MDLDFLRGACVSGLMSDAMEGDADALCVVVGGVVVWNCSCCCCCRSDEAFLFREPLVAGGAVTRDIGFLEFLLAAAVAGWGAAEDSVSESVSSMISRRACRGSGEGWWLASLLQKIRGAHFMCGWWELWWLRERVCAWGGGGGGKIKWS